MRYPLSEMVVFGGERMTYGRMVQELQKLARGVDCPQRLVDRYLQGFDWTAHQEKECLNGHPPTSA